MKQLLKELSWREVLITLLGSAIQAFGLYNIHDVSNVTEGGVLGLTLLLEHWFSISPAISGAMLNTLFYFTGWRVLGRRFLLYSFIATGGFSAVYWVCEQFPPLFPAIAAYPLLAAILGALFIGIGVGLCVRIGGAASGDDALAMSLSHLFRVKIQWVYLISDFIVLALSASYLPIDRLACSVLTMLLSGQIIGWVSTKKGN